MDIKEKQSQLRAGKVTPEQVKLRNAFKLKIPYDKLINLYKNDQTKLLAEFDDFKKENNLSIALKDELNYKNSENGKKQIIEFFSNYLENGMPTYENTYLNDMYQIRIRLLDKSIQRPNQYETLNEVFKKLNEGMTLEKILESRERDDMGKVDLPAPSMSPDEKEAIEGLQAMKKESKEESKDDTEDDTKEEEETKKESKEETKEDTEEAKPEVDPTMDSVPKNEGMAETIEEPSHTMPDGTKMSGKTHNSKSKIIDREPEILPTKIDSIPQSRLSPNFKDLDDLNDDIKYFLKNFSGLLKSEKGIYKKINKKDKPNLIKLHSRIVGKLSPKTPSTSRGKQVGVVIDAKEYIASELKRLMSESTFNNMRPEDVVIDLGYNEKEGNPDVKDYGDFEVKKDSQGGLSSRREAIYRYQPTEADKEVGEMGMSFKKKSKPKRLSKLPLKQINLATTAMRMVEDNPFLRKRRTNQLKYLY